MSEVELVRHTDAKVLNLIANDPDVRPWLGGEGELDLEPLAADPANLVLLTADASGGVIFTRIDAGCFELHTQFKRCGRGQARQAVKLALRQLFILSDCMELYTRVPETNIAARKFTESFRPVLQSTLPSIGLDGHTAQVLLYRMTLHDWVLTDSKWLAEPCVALALPPDPFVGATLRMAFSPALAKGALLYARYSRIAGFPPLTVLTAQPPRIMLGTQVLESLPQCQ